MTAEQDLVERIQRIEDYISITELKARYLRAVDSRDWDLLESVFLADATFVSLTGVTSQGTAGWLERAKGALEGSWSVHHAHMPEISIERDTATGIWALEDYVGFASGKTVHGYGHYKETYQRTPDGWRISRYAISRLREEWTETVVRPAFGT